MPLPALLLTACLLQLPLAHSSNLDQEKKKPPAKTASEAPAKPDDAEDELERALAEAGNDRAALVHNLKDYLERFPNTPRKAQVYRAIVEASLQLQDAATAVEYTERLIALRPDDSSMMLLAVDLLERAGDDRSLTRAVGYITRVLDRVEKAGEARPPDAANSNWELEKKKLVMSVYLIRGRLEMTRHRYSEAQVDLAKSYLSLPNAAAAMRLGEIAELQRHYENAIEHYTNAFVLQESYGADVDRREVRRKLGNVWRIVHGSEEGLGQRLLAGYDRATAVPAEPARNAEAAELAAFEVRRLDGTPWKLAELKDKVVVLHFWATWCTPCREVEPLLARVAARFRDNSAVVFLAANRDDEESLVEPYALHERWKTPAVFSDGLERLYGVNILPTLLVLDGEGRVLYRGEGFAPATLESEISAAIERALTAKKE